MTLFVKSLRIILCWYYLVLRFDLSQRKAPVSIYFVAAHSIQMC